MANLKLQNSTGTSTEITLTNSSGSEWKIVNNNGTYTLKSKGTDLFTLTDTGVTTFMNNVVPDTGVSYNIGSSSAPWKAVASKYFYIYDGTNNSAYAQLLMHTKGTTSTQGIAALRLGNALAAKTDGSALGRLTMYSNNAKYAALQPRSDLTYNGFIYLPAPESEDDGQYLIWSPNKNTSIGSPTLPVYINEVGKAVACTKGSVFGGFTSTAGENGETLKITVAGQERSVTLDIANETQGGVVTTEDQTFAGNKTFTGSITSNNFITCNTGGARFKATNGTQSIWFGINVGGNAWGIYNETTEKYILQQTASNTRFLGVSDEATKLETARTIAVNLKSTTAASFDGTANVTPGVTGILSVANGGTGAATLGSKKVLFGNGTSSIATYDMHINYSAGTTSVDGYEELVIGNAKKSGVANNAIGRVTLYSTGATGVYLQSAANSSGWPINTLPAVTGTLLNTGNYTSYLDSRYVNISGDTMSGNLFIERDATTATVAQVKNNNGAVDIRVSSNRGLYDTTNGSWIIYTGSDEEVARIPRTLYSYSIFPTTANHYNCGNKASPWYMVSSRRFNLYDGTNEAVYGYFQAYTQGTTETAGTTLLCVGNSVATGNAANSAGNVRIYGAGTRYHQIKTVDADTSCTSWLRYYGADNGYLVATTTTDAVGGTGTPVYVNANGVITACTLADLRAGKLYNVTETNPTSATRYNIPFLGTGNAASVATTSYIPRTNVDFNVLLLQGTADAVGYSVLELGNGTASGTAGNKYGMLRVYSQGATYCNLAAETGSSSRTSYLRDWGGTGYLVATDTTSAVGGTGRPVYINANGLATGITSLSVSYGGTGQTTLTSGSVLIGNGTSAVSLRAITNNTSATAVTASTNLITANTLYYHKGNSNIVTVGTITSGTWKGTKVGLAYGGTNATTAAGARQNIVYIGGNPITSTTDDTVANWGGFGCGVAYFNTAGYVTGQPSTYGVLFNGTAGGTINGQLWISSGGVASVRGSTSSGFSSWYKILTTKQVTYGTADPSGGSNGDIYLKYKA